MPSTTPIFQISNHRALVWIYILIVALLTGIAFGGLSKHRLNAIGDDQETLHDLQMVSEDITKFFSLDRQSPIRPSMDLVLLGGYGVWERNPKGYHILLVGLHGVAALLLAYTFLHLGVDRELSLVAGLLFLLNVAPFRTVQWVVCTGHVLALVFALLILIAYLRAQTSTGTRWILAAVLALGVAIFAHPSGGAVVLFCAYLTWRQDASIRQALGATAPLLVAASVFGVAVYLFSPGVHQVTGLVNRPDLTRLILNPPWYLSRLITTAHWLTPAGIGNIYRPWEIGLGVAAGLGALMLYRHRIFPAADGAVWAAIVTLPFLNNALNRLTVGPSRQLYMASAGSALVLAWALRALLHHFLAQQSARKKAIWVVLLVALFACSIWHLKRAEAIDFWLVGRSYIAAGEFETGMAQYEHAVAYAPDLIPTDTYYSWVPLLLSRGESPEQVLQNALVYHPESPTLHFLLGVSAFRQADPDAHRRGEKQMHEALAKTDTPQKMRYGGALAFHNLAAFHKQAGRHLEAADLFRRALELYPGYGLARKHLAEVLLEMGRTQEAQEHLQILEGQKKMSRSPSTGP